MHARGCTCGYPAGARSHAGPGRDRGARQLPQRLRLPPPRPRLRRRQLPAAPAATEAPVAAAGGQLRVTFSWPNRIDPAVGNDYASSTSLANLYDTLVFPNAKGGVDPAVASSWEISPDGLTYTFKLRDDVKFHDGSALKASDVVYSFDRLKAIGEGFAYLVTPDVASVEAPDDTTVVFKLSKPTALFLPSLGRLYVASEALVKANTKPDGPYGDNGDYGKEWLQTHDAGSGPYKVKEFPLEQYLLMEKNTDWWGKFHPNAPSEVRFIGTTEAVTVRSLMENKELEISDQWQSFEAYQALEKIDGREDRAAALSFVVLLHGQHQEGADGRHSLPQGDGLCV